VLFQSTTGPEKMRVDRLDRDRSVFTAAESAMSYGLNNALIPPPRPSRSSLTTASPSLLTNSTRSTLKRGTTVVILNRW
jgi:hypothetical protein